MAPLSHAYLTETAIASMVWTHFDINGIVTARENKMWY